MSEPTNNPGAPAIAGPSAADPLAEWTGRIHCGDAEEIMARIPAGSVDLVVTSPPYNLKNSTGNGMKDGTGSRWANASLRKGYQTHGDDMPHDEYVAWQRRCLSAMMRLLTGKGAIFYNHKWRVQDGLLQDRHDVVSGFPVRQIIVWRRSGGFNFNAGYFLPTYEVVYLIANPGFRLTDDGVRLGDVWDIQQEMDNWHPAAFPEALAHRCIGATTAGVVLDPFMGSGTTAAAAKLLHRRWIGIEISPEYCEHARRRVSQGVF